MSQSLPESHSQRYCRQFMGKNKNIQGVGTLEYFWHSKKYDYSGAYQKNTDLDFFLSPKNNSFISTTNHMRNKPFYMTPKTNLCDDCQKNYYFPSSPSMVATNEQYYNYWAKLM